MHPTLSRTLLAATLALPILATAQADATAQPAAACATLPADTERLACYDALFGSRPTGAARGPAPGTAAARPLPATMRPLRQAVSADRSGRLLDMRWDLGPDKEERFVIRPHRAVYLAPVSWSDKINQQPASPSPDHSVYDGLDLRGTEAKYQFSFKSRLTSADGLLGTPVQLWGAYTQSSHWQLYNGRISRPFRETNYEPELIATMPLDAHVLGWDLRMGALSLNHQSNGRSLPLSRSWNRVIGWLGLERKDWVVEVRPWARLPERAEDDDNPDVSDYMGRGELRLARYVGDHALLLQLRHSLRTGDRAHGSAQLEWAFPLSGVLHGFVQVFTGYGESLIDYNLRQNRLSLGVTLAGWR